MIQDIVCGIYLITTEGCKVSEVNDKKYYFCCDTCKAEFDNYTEKYVEDFESAKEINISQQKIEWERDPVCGERINISDAKGITLYKDSRYYFCCKICKKHLMQICPLMQIKIKDFTTREIQMILLK